MKHDALLFPLPRGSRIFAFYTRLLYKSLCVGLEEKQFLHGSLTINTMIWCLWLD